MTLEEFHRRHPVRALPPVTCWCGKANGLADDHICGECPEHCELAAHREGRPSPRDVELRRQLDERGRHPAAMGHPRLERVS